MPIICCGLIFMKSLELILNFYLEIFNVAATGFLLLLGKRKVANLLVDSYGTTLVKCQIYLCFFQRMINNFQTFSSISMEKEDISEVNKDSLS